MSAPKMCMNIFDHDYGNQRTILGPPMDLNLVFVVVLFLLVLRQGFCGSLNKNAQYVLIYECLTPNWWNCLAKIRSGLVGVGVLQRVGFVVSKD